MKIRRENPSTTTALLPTNNYYHSRNRHESSNPNNDQWPMKFFHINFVKLHDYKMSHIETFHVAALKTFMWYSMRFYSLPEIYKGVTST